MYQYVGLETTKGSGTNGYIQKSLAYIKKKEYQPGGYKSIIEKFKEQPAPTKRKINNEIIEHEMKYKIESELYDLSEKLKNEGKLNEKEIEEKINKKRKEMYKDIIRKKDLYVDNRDTHQRGQMKNEQINKIKNALNIKDDYQLGYAFDIELQEKEKEEREKKKKKLLLLNKRKERIHRHNHRKRKESRERRERREKRENRERNLSRSISRSRSLNSNKSRSYKKYKKRKYSDEYFYEKEEGSISN